MKRLGIIGGGNMGEAIIAHVLKHFKITVSEKEKGRQRYLKKKYQLPSESIAAAAGVSEAIILAIKPQDTAEVLDELKGHLDNDKLVISIAAGVTTRYIEQTLGQRPRVIRTMPNMPAMVAKGVTAICKGRYAHRNDIRLTQRIFSHLGKTIVVSENLLDTITAVSGSGPAYVFLFMEYLTKAAQALGLNEKVAKELVMETFSGSVHLIQEKNLEPALLRAKVTSKGGTTQAAIEVFRQKGLKQIIQQALTAAQKRAKALARR